MRHHSSLNVHLNLLSWNINRIKTIAPKATLLPMVKANAYGHGLVPISQYLYQEEKCQTLGVASLGEALELANSLENFLGRILVFSDSEITDPELYKHYLDKPIVPVLHHLDQLRSVLENKNLKFLPIIIKLDTGMNRLGIPRQSWQEASDLLKKHDRFEIEHLMTHFSVSFNLLKVGDKTHRQYQEFSEACAFFRSAGIQIKETSVSNSGAIEQDFGLNETFIRPGLMLYGAASVTYGDDKILQPMKVISTLSTVILKKFKASRGTPIGYGVNVLSKDATILVLPLGYGDGLLTFWSGVEWKLKNHKVKIFGRVNMDMCFIECPIEAFGDFEVGEKIDLWGEDPNHLTDLCSQIKTIPYQLFCAVSSRVPRIYRLKS